MLANHSVEESCRLIGADSLAFLSYDATLNSAVGRCDMCLACFNGDYPTPLYEKVENANKF